MKKLFLILSVALFALGLLTLSRRRLPQLPKPNSPAIACTA